MCNGYVMAANGNATKRARNDPEISAKIIWTLHSGFTFAIVLLVFLFIKKKKRRHIFLLTSNKVVEAVAHGGDCSSSCFQSDFAISSHHFSERKEKSKNKTKKGPPHITKGGRRVGTKNY